MGILVKTLLTSSISSGVYEWVRFIMVAITVAVTVIVCAVPESLPMLTSILLSLQNLKITRNNMPVRKINGLPAA